MSQVPPRVPSALGTPAEIRWRRLDGLGDDACRLVDEAFGWRLDGHAEFSQGGVSTRLRYTLSCDRHWVSRAGSVSGWIGSRRVDYTVVRSGAGEWRLNANQQQIDGSCMDLDLGSTPATNLTQLRRLTLAVGDAADVPVAWLDVTSGTLTVLDQHYARISSDTYRYEAPRFKYSGLLRVRPDGFVVDYPGLWTAE